MPEGYEILVTIESSPEADEYSTEKNEWIYELTLKKPKMDVRNSEISTHSAGDLAGRSLLESAEDFEIVHRVPVSELPRPAGLFTDCNPQRGPWIR